jgi:UDP-glucose 4-epimerase
VTATVLVTGGAGYIGSVVVDQLLARACRVVVLDDLSTGHRTAVADAAELIEANIGDRAAVEGLFASRAVDAIVHLAAFALVPESVAHPEKYRANNVTAARVLLDAAIAAGVRRFVFSSSCAVYGHPTRTPIDEDVPQAPVNPYGETKREFEQVLGESATRHGLASVSLRYFNAAGATERRGEDHDPETHLIPNVLGVALGWRPAVDVFGTDYPTADGTAVRDYIHVDDLADAHVRALHVPLTGAVALNLGSGTGHSVRQVVEAARRVTGHAIPAADQPRRPGDPPVLVAAGERAATVLGWRPRRSQGREGLEDILASAWRWHRAHPRGYRS